MIKISISGTATEEEKKQLDVAISEAISNYLGQFPTAAVKTHWRRGRKSVVVVNNEKNTTEVVVAVGDSMKEAQTATETPAKDVK
jgi:hypothetical protein